MSPRKASIFQLRGSESHYKYYSVPLIYFALYIKYVTLVKVNSSSVSAFLVPSKTAFLLTYENNYNEGSVLGIGDKSVFDD
ncbi:hypothetical protein [Virgibacillus sp. L01]|uniref:hypothetical protein n=1 Tax=Virgibacillus sp. L01 TaxID=3457429 RepID=UPI003FD1D8A9